MAMLYSAAMSAMLLRSLQKRFISMQRSVTSIRSQAREGRAPRCPLVSRLLRLLPAKSAMLKRSAALTEKPSGNEEDRQKEEEGIQQGELETAPELANKRGRAGKPKHPSSILSLSALWRS